MDKPDINFDIEKAIDKANQSGRDLDSLLSGIKDYVRKGADILPHAAYLYLLNVLLVRVEKTLQYTTHNNTASAILSAEARYLADMDAIDVQTEGLEFNPEDCKSCDKRESCTTYRRYTEVN